MALFYISAYLFNAWLSALSAGSSYLALWSICCDTWFWLMSMGKTSGFTYIRRRKKEDLGDPWEAPVDPLGSLAHAVRTAVPGRGNSLTWGQEADHSRQCLGNELHTAPCDQSILGKTSNGGNGPWSGSEGGSGHLVVHASPSSDGREAMPGFTREGSRATGIGKENSSCLGGEGGRACGVGRAGGGKPRSSCNGPGNGWLPFGRFWEDLSLSYVRVQSCCSRWWPWASETRLITLNRLF